jgi:predicted RNase H-like nuclease (RuvC/YqgF family)
MKNQLNEIEQLAEMASITQLKNQLEKQGKTKELSAVKAAEKSTIDKLKAKPSILR